MLCANAIAANGPDVTHTKFAIMHAHVLVEGTVLSFTEKCSDTTAYEKAAESVRLTG